MTSEFYEDYYAEALSISIEYAIKWNILENNPVNLRMTTEFLAFMAREIEKQTKDPLPIILRKFVGDKIAEESMDIQYIPTISNLIIDPLLGYQNLNEPVARSDLLARSIKGALEKYREIESADPKTLDIGDLLHLGFGRFATGNTKGALECFVRAMESSSEKGIYFLTLSLVVSRLRNEIRRRKLMKLLFELGERILQLEPGIKEVLQFMEEFNLASSDRDMYGFYKDYNEVKLQKTIDIAIKWKIIENNPVYIKLTSKFHEFLKKECGLDAEHPEVSAEKHNQVTAAILKFVGIDLSDGLETYEQVLDISAQIVNPIRVYHDMTKPTARTDLLDTIVQYDIGYYKQLELMDQDQLSFGRLVKLGIGKFILGDTEEALECLQMAIRMAAAGQPRQGLVFFTLTTQFQDLQDEARRDATRQLLVQLGKLILKDEPDSLYVLSYLGTFYFFQKNYSEAIKYLKRAVKLEPDDSAAFAKIRHDALSNLVEAYSKIGDEKKSQKYAKMLQNEGNDTCDMKSQKKLINPESGLFKIKDNGQDMAEDTKANITMPNDIYEFYEDFNAAKILRTIEFAIKWNIIENNPVNIKLTSEFQEFLNNASGLDAKPSEITDAVLKYVGIELRDGIEKNEKALHISTLIVNTIRLNYDLTKPVARTDLLDTKVKSDIMIYKHLESIDSTTLDDGALMKLGVGKVASGDAKGALECFHKAIRMVAAGQPRQGLAFFALTTQFRNLQDEARRNAVRQVLVQLGDRILKDEPDSVYVLFYLGTFYFLQKNYSEAIKYLKRFVELKPDDSAAFAKIRDDALSHLVEAYSKIGDKKKSQKYAKMLQNEGNVTVSPQKNPTCDICEGTGICSSCNGQGKVRAGEICEMCDGTGTCFCRQ